MFPIVFQRASIVLGEQVPSYCHLGIRLTTHDELTANLRAALWREIPASTWATMRVQS